MNDLDLDSNSFALSLADMESGSLIPRASEQLNELVKIVRNSSKGGTLTLVIGIKPCGANGQVEITTKLTTKAPAQEPGKSIFFATEHGQLLRHDPRQKQLPFGDADAPRKAGNQ